jgi:hypothetical protein
MTPEVRLSPDGKRAALYRVDQQCWVETSLLNVLSERAVAGWTPLLPAASEDGAA